MTEKLLDRVVHIMRQVPRNDADSWRMCVDGLLPRVYIATREADLMERKRHARLLAVAALRAAGLEDEADCMER